MLTQIEAHDISFSPKEDGVLTEKINDPKLKNPPSGFLSWFSNSLFEQREINSLISLGRDSSQMVVLDDPFVSRRHARIEKDESSKNQFILKDMNSRNGTFLNGNRIFKAILRDNDQIRVGQKKFVFSFQRFDRRWNLFKTSLNPGWNKQLSRLAQIAQTPFPVLIYGPSGSGKEHIAQMIHSHSQRNTGPYVSVNCSALTETLAESEFFGHIKGSYTGALRDRKGAFATADKGTLFLDEIGDLPLHLQPKLLRALETQEIKPVGSDQIIKVDVRVVSATHQNLHKKVLEKKFREDLYFRLHVLEMNPPPLKDRLEDFDNLLNNFSSEFGVRFDDSARSCLKKHTWPGNIRELKNTVVRARAIFPRHHTITEKDVPEVLDSLCSILAAEKSIQQSVSSSLNTSHDPSLSLIKKVEKEMILKVLQENDNNQSRAAAQLGVARSTLISKLKSFGLHPSP